MNSDAVFHQELEYAIGFKIQATNDELLSIFRKNAFYILQKNAKKSRKSTQADKDGRFWCFYSSEENKLLSDSG
jgi:hypothetical protein